jgi:hypothetical protein
MKRDSLMMLRELLQKEYGCDIDVADPLPIAWALDKMDDFHRPLARAGVNVYRHKYGFVPVCMVALPYQAPRK